MHFGGTALLVNAIGAESIFPTAISLKFCGNYYFWNML